MKTYANVETVTKEQAVQDLYSVLLVLGINKDKQIGIRIWHDDLWLRDNSDLALIGEMMAGMGYIVEDLSAPDNSLRQVIKFQKITSFEYSNAYQLVSQYIKLVNTQPIKSCLKLISLVKTSTNTFFSWLRRIKVK